MAKKENVVTIEEAIRRLRLANHGDAANALAAYHNKDGNRGGWDGWIRGHYLHVVPTIWPDE